MTDDEIDKSLNTRNKVLIVWAIAGFLLSGLYGFYQPAAWILTAWSALFLCFAAWVYWPRHG